MNGGHTAHSSHSIELFCPSLQMYGLGSKLEESTRYFYSFSSSLGSKNKHPLNVSVAHLIPL